MSAHLLPVSPAWLAKLPDGVLLVLPPTDGLARLDDGTRRRTLPTSLVLDDAMTAAAVAAKIVAPWGRRAPRLGVPEWIMVHLVMGMDPMTRAQLETLARLARAAMEEQ